MPAPIVGAAAAVAAKLIAKKLSQRAAGGISGAGAKNINPIYKETVPKQIRQASEARKTQYNKKLKDQLKSSDTKESSDIHVAKNTSGGTKPFSKGNYPPTGPKVPNKKK